MLTIIVPIVIKINREAQHDLFWCDGQVLCRRCIEECKAFPRFEGDDPNDWHFNEHGTEEARRHGLAGAWLGRGDMNPERVETWFVGDYHLRFRGLRKCEHSGTICMSEINFNKE